MYYLHHDGVAHELDQVASVLDEAMKDGEQRRLPL